MAAPDRHEMHPVLPAVGLLSASTERLTVALAQQLEIGVTDLRALYVVHTSREASAKSVGTVLGITSGSTTPLVDRLVSRGFLRRVEHPTDRRSSLLELTPAGRHSVAWMTEQVGGALVAALGDLDAADLERFRVLLVAVSSALDEVQPTA